MLWFRYHNYLADEIAAANPGLNDEQVFNLAKKKLIAVYQVGTSKNNDKIVAKMDVFAAFYIRVLCISLSGHFCGDLFPRTA